MASRRQKRERLVGASLLALAGCITPPYSYSPPLEDHAVPESVIRVDLRAIPVRLATCERARELLVEGTESGSTRIVSAGSRVAIEGGGSFPDLLLEPADSEQLLIGKRAYAGVLRVTSHPSGGLRVTNLVDLESYVRGVVAGESVLWSACPTELEVQAICARSYAVATLQARLGSATDASLWDDTRDQVYLGSGIQSTAPRGDELERKLQAAVDATRGQVLGLGGRVLDARFHAACGGTTARFRDIFGYDSTAAAIPSVRCAPCSSSSFSGDDKNSWSFTASTAELSALAKRLKLGSTLASVRPTQLDAHGRWLQIELAGDRFKRTISSAELRRELGATRMRSALILRAWPPPGSPLEGGLHLEGRGRGHGVGLCQVGSRELANLGWTATRILTHYYPSAGLGRIDLRGEFHSRTAGFGLE